MEALITTLFVLFFINALALIYLWDRLKSFCDLYDTVSHNSITNQRYLEKKVDALEIKVSQKVKKTSLTENTNAPIKKSTRTYRKDKP
jgi:hypothetical protein